MNDPLIESLRAALDQSPGNVPLRLSLARVLTDAHRYEDAEREYMAGLTHAAHDVDLKTGLAEVFYAQGKVSAALVIGEELISKGFANSSLYLVTARALNNRGEHEKALDAYRRAKELNPEAVDDELESLAHGLPGIRTDELNLEFRTGDPGGKFEPYHERPGVTFADVGGMEEVKEQIRLKIIHPLTHPEVYAAYGKKAGGGILMFGPPGCGKTHLARATAGEVKAKFISVAISDVLDMYTGQSERNLHDIFQSARANKPTVLFFDEVDALAASRRDMRQSAGRQVINQFLAELDGVNTENEGVLIMAATNAPWHLDGAFRRPGRFDRILFVPPPDAAARAEILRVLLRDKPAADVDVAALADKAKDLSGADLKAAIDVAVEAKLESAIKTGRPDPLSTKDLGKAIKRIKPSTKEWFKVARNHALYANEGGLYDDILKHLGIER